MRFIQWTVALALSLTLITAVWQSAPIGSLTIIAISTAAAWLLLAAELSREAIPVERLHCGTCSKTFTSLIEYNDHVYELRPHDLKRHINNHFNGKEGMK